MQHISDRIVVMYLGKIVELSTAEEIFGRAYHPYTVGLLSSSPIPDSDARRERVILEAGVPSAVNPRPGCRFHPRCAKAKGICSQLEPELVDIGRSHLVACHQVEKGA